ncbi:MAG: hypothetical protein Q4C47_04105 [Planctomycetia bacterium]|nr:hypothetical protein [Planctomycetia bacterium]
MNPMKESPSIPVTTESGSETVPEAMGEHPTQNTMEETSPPATEKNGGDPRESSPEYRCRWWVPVIPLVVYLFCGVFEPSRTTPAVLAEDAGLWERWTALWTFSFDWYPAYYFFRIAITLSALLLVMPGIRRRVAGDFGTWRWSAASLGIGCVGTFLWVGLCEIPLNQWLVSVAGMAGDTVSSSVASFFGGMARTGFNPFRDMPAISTTSGLTLFLIVRFTGLAIVVPVVEELFLRRGDPVGGGGDARVRGGDTSRRMGRGSGVVFAGHVVVSTHR